MIIGGLQKCSFIDFPEQVSAVVFVKGCNLSCGYCHNPSLFNEDIAPLNVEQVLSFLSSRRGKLGGVVVTGGEPLLQADLKQFIALIKGMKFKVKLDTNGTSPVALKELVSSGLLDYVAMDLKDLPSEYPSFCGMRGSPDLVNDSIQFLLKQGVVDYEFRTTVLTSRHDGKKLAKMAKVVGHAKRWVLQQFKPGVNLSTVSATECPSVDFMEHMSRDLSLSFNVNCSWR